MGDGTEQNPYTREDVLRLIAENGGKAEGLDLSGKVFQEGIDLSGVDLKGIILNNAHLEGADLTVAHLEGAGLREAHLEEAILLVAHLEEAILWGAHLEEADLTGAHLEEADLWEAHLEGAILLVAHLEGADLWEAHLEEARLWGAHLEAALLEDADWGNYILGEEKEGNFDAAVDAYRRLKIWYTEHGIYDVAGEFFFKEMTARRKALKWWPNPLNRAFAKLVSVLCGYGEKPERVVASATVITFGLAAAYFVIGSVWEWSAFWKSLYFSAVSFTALGYGSWVDKTWVDITNDWTRGLEVFESFLGVFLIALFLVTFTRKMTR